MSALFHLFLSWNYVALLLFGLVDGGRIRQALVGEALPTAASLVCVFDDIPSNESSPQSRSNSPEPNENSEAKR
jgi:hypothetical protein